MHAEPERGALPPLPITTDATAFALAHARLDRWLRRTLRERVGNDDTAEELTQRTWAAVWSSVASGRYDPNRSAISTYVYAVARNVHRQWLAERKPAGVAPESSAAAPDPLYEAEVIDAVRRALREPGAAGLSPEDATILRAIGRGDEGSDRSLAVLLGIAPSTAHARKKAALATLRAYLEKKFPDGTPSDSRARPSEPRRTE